MNGALGDRATRRIRVDLHASAQQRGRIEPLQHNICVGQRWLDAAASRSFQQGVGKDGGNRGQLAGLILEQIDGVRGVMPEQMIGPAPRLAGSVDAVGRV